MMRLARILTLLLLAVGVAEAHAQDDPEYRLEVGAAIGTTGYLGDFNGNLTKDLQPAAALIGRYNFNPWMALRLNVAVGELKGDAKDVTTYYPDYTTAGYTFSNRLYSADVTYEYNFWPYGTGWDYRGAKRLTPFVFGGIGMAVAKTPEKSHAALTLPLGLGVKYKIGDRVNIGLEWAIDFTTNDWLDGVKDPYQVESSGMFKNTDCFSRLQLSISYSFSPRCVTCNKE